MTALIRIERGQPTDDELAAVIAALRARGGHPPAPPASPGPGRWVASARPRPGRIARPGPNAWRRSALP